MRAALISMTGQPRDETRDAPLMLAGKTLAHRQLDFALAAGCERVIAIGDGSSAEAIALRHAAEAAGARFQTVRDSHGLLGTVRADDELLVLAPGLLPDSLAALDMLGKGRVVLVLPAAAGVTAGFERIDLERAWAGALTISGAQVERLSDLPIDIEPASALVRIAMQARAPEKRLPDELLADGSWSMLDDAFGTAAAEQAWLARHAPPPRQTAPTEWLARFALRPLARRLLGTPRSLHGLILGTLVALAGAIFATGYGLAVLGFALIALGALLAQASMDLARLSRTPFIRSMPRSHVVAALPWLIDGAILVCSCLAIEGTWAHRFFPPLVLLGVLYAGRFGGNGPWAALPGDRGLLAALLAIAAGPGLVEPGVMLLSLALIALDLAQSRPRSG